MYLLCCRGAPLEPCPAQAEEHYTGDFHFVDLNSATYWSAPLEEVRLDGVMRLSATTSAIVDSGTSLLVGPKSELTAIAAMIGATSLFGFHTIPCHKAWAASGVGFRSVWSSGSIVWGASAFWPE